MYTEWICFADEFPREFCGLIIKIKPEPGGENLYNITENMIFYGHLEGTYIFIEAEIDGEKVNNCLWKAQKEYEYREIYWYNAGYSRIQPL
jgi:hypothetical protein